MIIDDLTNQSPEMIARSIVITLAVAAAAKVIADNLKHACADLATRSPEIGDACSAALRAANDAEMARLTSTLIDVMKNAAVAHLKSVRDQPITEPN